MTLGFRQGGFGSPGMGPFRTGGGDFGRYNIGDDGAQLDAAKRDAAVIAWGNGTITNDTYLAALKAYWQKQDKDDSRWLSARDDYEDAVYSIGRNERVRRVNNASTSRQRLAALDALIGYDQRRLGTMTARGNNEQAAELQDRIADAEGQMRETRYGDQVNRYNNDRMTTEQMLAAARRMANQSRGAPDHETWVGRVTEWENRQWDEGYATAQDAYRRTLLASNGNIRAAGDHLIKMLEQRLGTMGPGTPGRKNLERQLRDMREQVVEDVWNRRVADAQIAVNSSQMTDSQYIAVLYDRVRALPDGSQAKKEAKSQLLNDTYALGERRIRERLDLPDGDEEHLDPWEAVPFYQGYLGTMSPGTSKYREIVQRINELRIAGIQDVSLTGKPGDVRNSNGGHWILPTGQPNDGNLGFTSQFDGSAFATQNCMFASAAMMFDALGGADLSGADLRRYAGDPEGAGFQSDIQRAYEQLGFATDRYNGMGFNQFMRRLDKSQGGALVIGLLASLPQQFRLTSGGGAHAVYITKRHRVVDGVRFTWVMDPLGRAGYDGAWWPDQVLQDFAWSGARNPISGNSIYGNVVFGKRGGRSNVTSTPRGDDYTPRFQAFDTDAHRRSTVGKGGGTSREEAGPVTDWTKQKDRKPPKGAPLKGTQGVSAFLEAVGRLPGSDMAVDESGRQETDAEKQARAAALMAEYKGDARLMALAWFGMPVNPDTTQWSDSDRFYANAVATRLGYNKVPPQGVGTIIPGTQSAPDLGPGNAQPTVTPGNESAHPHDQGRAPGVEETMPVADAIARQVLDELGWPQTPDMERAVTAWMRTESPKDTVSGNNPFGIRTPGPHDLPGQVGVTDDGRAIFGSMSDGIRAATSDLQTNYPDVIAAGNSGNSEKLLQTLDGSGYREGGYQGSLIAAYNQTPGSEGFIIGGTTPILDVPANIGDLSGRHSDIAELFRVVPDDPAQVEWFERNLANAKAAMIAGSASWIFETPGGVGAKLDFNPEMAAQLTATRADLYEQQALVEPDPLVRFGLDTKANATRDQAMAMQGDIAQGFLDTHLEGLERTRQDALLNGDLTGAANAVLAKDAAIHRFVGVPIGEVIDIDAIRLANAIPGLTEEDYDRLIPRVDENEQDPILVAIDKDFIYIERDAAGNITSLQADPDYVYVRQGENGRPEVRTRGQGTQDEFAPVTIVDPTTGEAMQASAYTQNHVWVGSRNMWIERTMGTAVGSVLDYAGYRNPVTPQTVANMGDTGQWPGSDVLGVADSAIDGLNALGGAIFDPLTRALEGRYSPQNRQQTTQTTSPAPTTTPGRTPQDGMIVRGSLTIPVHQVEVIDPVTLRSEIWVSVDGNTWIGGERDKLRDNPVEFVFNEEANVNVARDGQNHQFLVWSTGPKAGQALTDDELTSDFYAQNTHIRGSRPEDRTSETDPPWMGAQGSFYKVIFGADAPGGGRSLDTTQPDLNPEVEKWRNVTNLPSVTSRPGLAERIIARTQGREPLGPSWPTTVDQRLIRPGLGFGGLVTRTPLVTPPVKPGPNVMASLARWKGAASTAIANGTARQTANARSILAAAERSAAILARNRAVAQQRNAAVDTTPAPTPKPVGTTAPTPPPKPSPTFTPRADKPRPPTPQTGPNVELTKPRAPTTPRPSPTPGPRRE